MMSLASTTSTSSASYLLSTALCTARRTSLPLCQTHHQLRFLSTFRKCNLNWQRSLGKNTEQRVRSSAVGVEDEACELVNGVEISIGEGDDNIQAFLFKAVKNNNGTGLLLLSDVFGFQDSATRDFAYQVACHGYNVLVPDLFRGDPWAKGRPKTMFEQWMASQDPQRVANDIASSTKWLVDEFTAAGISKKLGIIGFCFGGGRVIDVLAADQGACFSIAVSFYGTRMDPSAAYKVKVPVLFISGENDPVCQVSVLSEFEKSIGKGSRVVIFKGRGHAFAHRPGSPEEDADAEQAFTLMNNWLHDGLVVNS
ncbi:carboxymethylenebutenolidase homolog isoform X1 [Durio zibethinus]|uniref:Carboxymethylenebutenolidase homolog n=1 Tax=Durio zibethinus TaxID=66656 RepID=A0A6P5XHH0_DURZI|nr:carboxymethylenebutenolidase homolog isoform X1 [Durio zibethinus]